MKKNDILAVIRLADDFVKQNKNENEIEQLKTACLINVMNSITPGIMVNGYVQIQIDDCLYKIEDAYLQGYLPKKKYQSFLKKQNKENAKYSTTDNSVFTEAKELEDKQKRDWLLDKLCEYLKKQPYTTEEGLLKENERLKAELESYKELYRKEKVKNNALKDRIQFSYLMNRQSREQNEKGRINGESAEIQPKIDKTERKPQEEETKEKKENREEKENRPNEGKKTEERLNIEKDKSTQNTNEEHDVYEVHEVQDYEKSSEKVKNNAAEKNEDEKNELDKKDGEAAEISNVGTKKLSDRYQNIKFTSEKEKGTFCFDAYIVNVKSWAGKLVSNHAITVFPFYENDLRKGFCVSVVNNDGTKDFYTKFGATYIDIALGVCRVRISLSIEESSFKVAINSVTSDPQYGIDIEKALQKRSDNQDDLTGHLVLPYGDGVNVVHILPIGGQDEDLNYTNYIYVVEDGESASGGEINNGSCPVITNGKEPQKILCAWQDKVCVAQLGDPDYEYV